MKVRVLLKREVWDMDGGRVRRHINHMSQELWEIGHGGITLRKAGKGSQQKIR